MSTWKLPPKAKIYEALSAVGDDRVKITRQDTAEVMSSDRSKTYLVEWSPDVKKIRSNDNASYWQGYMGYPIIAVLMTLSKLDFDKDLPQLLSGIPWKTVNKRFRNDYDKAVASVLETLDAECGCARRLAQEVDNIMKQLEALKLEKPPRGKRPPKR